MKYFQDPKRPQLPEHPNTKTSGGRVAPPERGGHGDPYQYSGPPRDITRNPVYGGHRGERGGGWPGEERERAYRGPPPPRRDYGGGHHRSRGGGGDGGPEEGRGAGECVFVVRYLC